MRGFIIKEEVETWQMTELSFDTLNSTQFEEFMFDLLLDLGYKNVDWRKGTGLCTSPSDQGRDIECEKLTKDEVDGEVALEKWFVEAKHQKKGIPPSDIEGALAWAMAERPSCLLLVATGYFSNPCKEYIKKFIDHNKPPFKVKFWEFKELERITFSRLLLLKKYGIANDLAFIKLMNPIHLNYAATIHFNTLDYFFQLIDELDSDKRDDILGHAFFEIVDPRIIEPDRGKKTIGETYSRRVDYKSFRERCQELDFSEPRRQLVDYIVSITLGYIFNLGNSTRQDRLIEMVKVQIAELEAMMNDSEKRKELEERMHLDKAGLRKSIDHTKSTLQKHIEGIPAQTQYYYDLYTEFCEKVVLKLMDEELIKKGSEL